MGRMKKILIVIALLSLLAIAAAPVKMICHVLTNPPSTIFVSPGQELAEHLGHGDYHGVCTVTPTPTTPVPTETPTETPTPTPEPTGTPEPTPEPTGTPEPTETPLPSTAKVVIPNMWLLTREGWDCLIRSETHPSEDRQRALCFRAQYPNDYDPARLRRLADEDRRLNGWWVADNAPCAGPVYSMFESDDDGYWRCDKYTPWRLPLETLNRN